MQVVEGFNNLPTDEQLKVLKVVSGLTLKPDLDQDHLSQTFNSLPEHLAPIAMEYYRQHLLACVRAM